jgi:hypothetical protein
MPSPVFWRKIEGLMNGERALPYVRPQLNRHWSTLIFCLLNENADHRLAASAVVVDETTGGTSDFPCSNRNRSGSGVAALSLRSTGRLLPHALHKNP